MDSVISLATPYYLGLFPILTLICLATLFYPRRPRGASPWILATLRVLSLAALCIALAGPYTSKERPASSLVALVDVASSMDEQVGSLLLDKARALARDAGVDLSLIPFGGEPLPSAITSSLDYAALRSTWQKVDIGRTNLEKAVLALHLSSAQSALVISDGYQTDGSVSHELANSASTRLYPLTLDRTQDTDSTDEPGLDITQLFAPLTAKAQKSVEIRASVKSTYPQPKMAQFSIRHGDREIFSQTVPFPAGEESVLLAQSDPSAEGLNEITATLSWSDTRGPHTINRKIWLSGEKRERVLLINGTPEDARLLPTILRDQTYSLVSVTGGERANSIGALADFSVVILNNIPRSQLPSGIEAEIPGYVRRGGGLIMIGGNKSFGLGGYIDSDIEPLLPVRLLPPTAEKKRLNVAVQLVIDKSKSMDTDARLAYAKDAATLVVRNLKDDDLIGVIGFDETAFIVQPLKPLFEVRDQAIERIRTRLSPVGGTKPFSAIDEARRGLLVANAGRKHIILLTDGKIPDASDEYSQLVRQMRPLGITLSTILIGDAGDGGFLDSLAQIGGGRYYANVNPQNLPSIFLSDIHVTTGERTMKESTTFGVREGTDGIVSTSLREFPSLRGLVETLRKDGAATELVALGNDKASPLLASMRVGKGKSIAYTSDANGRWSSDWMRWSDIPQFWSDIVDAARPNGATDKKRFDFDLRSWVDRGEVVLDLSLYDDPEGDSVKASVVLPNGESKDVDFLPQSPGHYQVRIPNGSAGKYVAAIRVGQSPLPEIAWSLSGELFGEQPHKIPDLATLEEIAFKSGGKVNPTVEDFKEYIKNSVEKKEWSFLFLLVALGSFALEIALREFGRNLSRAANRITSSS